jgi:hypothetical protein
VYKWYCVQCCIAEVLQGRGQHGEKVGYCYPSIPEKTLCKWDIYVPLATKGLMTQIKFCSKKTYCFCVEIWIEEGVSIIYINIACAINSVEINLYYQSYMNWNTDTADAQNLLRDLPEDDTRGVPKHVWRDFMYLLCIYSSERKVNFIRNVHGFSAVGHKISSLWVWRWQVQKHSQLALHGMDILAVIRKEEADGQVALAYQLIFG